MIGNDQGLLSAPVAVNRMPLAPAERADIVVDFARMAGTHVKLVSDSFDLMQFRVASGRRQQTRAQLPGISAAATAARCQRRPSRRDG